MQLDWSNVEEMLREIASRYAAATALSIRSQGEWKTLSFAGVESRVHEAAQSLLQSGVRPGDRLALLGSVSLDWPIQFLAGLLAGAVVIPCDPKLSESELLHLLGHAEPRFLVASREFRPLGFALRAGTPSIEKLIYFEMPFPLFASEKFPLPNRSLRDCAAIFYTSGTLGAPKGVMVSFEMIFAALTMLRSLAENEPGDVIFSILPMTHLYGLTAGVLFSLSCGAEYCFAHSLTAPEILLCLVERKVTQIQAVPLLLSVLRRGILKKVSDLSPRRQRVFHALLKVAPFLPIPLRRRLFRSLHEGFGGHLLRIVSGAAPLDRATRDFFWAVGLPVYEGYGLTETGPVICVNTSSKVRRGTVGRALPCVEVRVDQPAGEFEGEIYTRGPHVMLGYYKNPELTRDALDPEGWFRTEDIGCLEDGYLRITGRKKNLIVLASGKKVHAEEVENALEASEAFREFCVLGLSLANLGEQVTAVVVPALLLAGEEPGSAELRKRMEAEVKRSTANLAAFKQPGRVFVRTEPLPKTTTSKVKYHALRREIEAAT